MRSLYWSGNKNSKNEDSDKKQQSVEVVSNHIYFYNEVEEEPILNLNKAIKETTNKIINQANAIDADNPKIYLHINSPGGEIFCGFAAMDTILLNPVQITTIAEGQASSAASLMSMVGKRRLITRHSYILIHQISTGFMGKHDELEDEVKNMEKFMAMLKKVYLEYTKIPSEMLDEILKHDLYFNAEESIKFGLADEII
jgi:ATP-dependent Clp protease protease subunit